MLGYCGLCQRAGTLFITLALVTTAASAVGGNSQKTAADAKQGGELRSIELAQYTGAAQISPAVNPGSAASDVAPPSADGEIASRMSNVERVNIRIPGLPTLSGEYRIGGDGTVALPGIGRLKVANSTISEFEAQVATEIQRISNRETSVAIEVVEYRPIYVSGAVMNTGAFPWKPGFSVLHAETLAGGISRGPVASGGAMAAVGTVTDGARERAVRSAYALAATLATITRLEAELANDTHYALPPRVAALISTDERQSLEAAQQAILKSNVSLFKAKTAAADAAEAIAAKEKSAHEEQIIRIRDQLTKRRSLLKKLERMTENRFARGDRLFEEQVRVAELEERLTTTTLAISRAEVAAEEAKKQKDNLVLGRKADIDGQFLALEEKKAELEIAIDSSNDVYRRATGQDAIESRVSSAVVPRYEIIRVEHGRTSVVKAAKQTPLIPGDVVVVALGRPDAS